MSDPALTVAVTGGLMAVTVALIAIVLALLTIARRLDEIVAALLRQPVQVEPRRVTVGQAQREPMFKHEGVLPEAMGTPGDD